MNVKPKRKKLKSGEATDFDWASQEASTQFDEEVILDAWEYYDSMKFYIMQQSNKKKK